MYTESQSNNHSPVVIPQKYIDEARAFLADAADSHLIQIIAASLYMDDMGGVA